MTGIREEGIEWLLNSGFVDALVKKNIFPSDIDNYYEDYLQETWLCILELKDTVWERLYNTAIETGTDYIYQVRNYISRIILNTCKSDSSNAYRRLKRHNATELHRNDMQWELMENGIADDKDIFEQIKDNSNE